jgi:hypothetical protein
MFRLFFFSGSGEADHVIGLSATADVVIDLVAVAPVDRIQVERAAEHVDREVGLAGTQIFDRRNSEVQSGSGAAELVDTRCHSLISLFEIATLWRCMFHRRAPVGLADLEIAAMNQSPHGSFRSGIAPATYVRPRQIFAICRHSATKAPPKAMSALWVKSRHVQWN